MDPAHTNAEVLVVANGRIEAVGPRAVLEAYPAARVRTLNGKTLLPGFIDAHNHLSVAALHPLWADLSGVQTLGQLQRALDAQSRAEPEARWVRGVDWNELSTDFPLTRRELDGLGIDRPVIVVHYSYHQCVVSSAGLEELGIGRGAPDPEGGEIVRGVDGQPTGQLIERAWSDAQARSLAAYTDPDRWGELIEQRARVLHQHGITCVHDAACSPEAETVYARLARSGRLPLGVLAMPHPASWFSAHARERFDGPVTGEGDEQFRIGPLKFFADGGAQPAIDVRMGGHRIVHGQLFPDLTDPIARCVERGFGVAVHAMGNRGVDSALQALDRASRIRRNEDHRFRLEHATVATPDQVKRLSAMGVVAVVQPGFVELFGRYRERGLWPDFDDFEPLAFRDLREAGVALAASSDDPCGPVPPLQTSRYGVSRQTTAGGPLAPLQSLDYEEWIRAYTLGAAYAGRQEGERGSLTPGKRADLVVVDGEIALEGVLRVQETWVGGELAFSAEAT
jgi:predicted amidohydrolase YtcJ